jgi:hypothetical protein
VPLLCDCRHATCRFGALQVSARIGRAAATEGQRCVGAAEIFSRNQYVEAYFASISGNGDYDGIRLVNFVRRQVAAAVEPAEIISEVSNTASSLWADDALLIPALDGDPLLYCLEPEEGEAGEPEVPADPLLRVVGVGITETK